MRDYVIEVTVRNDCQEGEEGSERVFTCTSIRALTELDARRKVLERAWANHLIVCHFNSVKTRQPKSK